MIQLDHKQEDIVRRIYVFKQEIAEQELQGENCPLLLTQLNNLYVMTNKLSKHLHDYRKSVEEKLK